MGRPPTPKSEQDFWNMIDIGRSDECWTWKGPIHKRDGYGNPIKILKHTSTPHRHAYVLYHKIDYPPSSIFVCHSCDNPPCCNPNHLWLGTCADNSIDMAKKDRGTIKLTNKQVKEVIEFRKQGYTQRKIANMFNVKQGTISSINTGKNRKVITNGQKININLSIKLTDNKVKDIITLRRSGKSIKFIAKKFNVQDMTICKILKGKTWKHITKGEKVDLNISKKLSDEQVREIYALKNSGLLQKQVAQQYNCSTSLIGLIWSKERRGALL